MVVGSPRSPRGGKEDDKKSVGADAVTMFKDKYVLIYSRVPSHQKGLVKTIKRMGINVTCAEGDMRGLKKLITEVGEQLLAVIVNADPDARPAPYELIKDIRNRGDEGDHGWGDRVVVVTLPVETQQEEFQRYLCKKEGQCQGTFLLTGDKFYYEIEDIKELEFEMLNRFFQNVAIRSISREIMSIADQFSVNSELSTTEVSTYLTPSKYGEFASWLKKSSALDAAVTNWAR